MQQISLAGLEQLLHLRSFERLLQDHFTGPEVTRTIRADRLFANITHGRIKDAVLALGTFANRFLAGKINFRHSAFRIAFVLPEIEFHFVFWCQAQNGGERFPHSAAEPLQRAGLAVPNQRFDFPAFKEFARNDLPQRKITLHALKGLVAFVDFAATLGARNIEHAEIARNRVEFEAFGPIYDMARHIGNAGHKIIPTFLPALYLPQLEFPVPGQFRLGQFGNAQAVEQFHQ